MPTYQLRKEKRIIMEWLRRLGVEFQTGFVVLNHDAEDSPIIYANQAFCEMSGYSEEEFIGENGRFMHGLKTDDKVVREIRECIASKSACTYEVINYHKNGTPFWNEITVQPINIRQQGGTYTLMLQRDITNRKWSEALIKLQQEIYRDIEKGYMLSALLQKACATVESFFQDDAKCTVMLVDEDGRFRVGAGSSMPKEFCEKTDGILAEEAVGTCGSSFHQKASVIVEDMRTDPLWENLQELVETVGFVSSWSVPIYDNEGNPVGTFGIYFEQQTLPTGKQMEFIEQVAPIVSLTLIYFRQQTEILELAYIDKETDLSNRNYFMNELKEMLPEKKEGFIAFISIDEYVKVVDRYGHRAGDSLIREVGKRFLLAKLPADNLVARFSDSTIALFCLTPLAKVPDYLEVLSQQDPVSIEDMELFLTLKMGVAIVTAHQQNEDELIRYADSALSKAKLRAGETICYYENEHDESMMKDLRIVNELTAALKRGEIDVHFQPKVELKTGKILSFEALARWTSPELGTIAPNVFIPAAEKNGKIRLLEQGVLKRVLTWLKYRQDRGLELSQVAVNVSTDHFFHHSFIPYLVDKTTEYGIEPKWIQLEITERIGFVDIETAYKVFRQLRQYGFTSSIDDFGTGYSSLSYLQKLPVNEIKIDRSFIANMHEPQTLAIVQTIIQLADNLNMRVVAEGIETEEQRRKLLAMGCRIGQGFYYYRPMSLDEINLL